MKKGDLVWLPSDITLLQLDDSGAMASKFLKLEEPTSALLIEEGEIYHKILFNGQTWSARRIDIYPHSEGKNHVD